MFFRIVAESEDLACKGRLGRWHKLRRFMCIVCSICGKPTVGFKDGQPLCEEHYTQEEGNENASKSQ